LADPAKPRYVGALNLVAAGKGVSLHYGPDWLASGFALSEDLPLINTEFLPQGRLALMHRVRWVRWMTPGPTAGEKRSFAL
jgi:hypothetical protein